MATRKKISLRSSQERANPLTQITLDNGQPLLNKEQIKRLNNITTNPEYLYYFSNSIKTYGFDPVYDKLTVDDRSNRSLVLAFQEFDSARYQQYQSNRIYKERLEGIKNLFKCDWCKKSEVIYYEKQTRSGDEGMTATITCVHCKHVWKIQT